MSTNVNLTMILFLSGARRGMHEIKCSLMPRQNTTTQRGGGGGGGGDFGGHGWVRVRV
jgi:hypothetical protein